MSILDAQVMVATSLLILFAGSLLVVGTILRAMLVVGPLVLLVPWSARGVSGESSAHLALCAASTWTALVAARRFAGQPRTFAAVLAVIAGIGTVFAGRHAEAWFSPLWYQQTHGTPFNIVDTVYNKWFYIAPLVAFWPLIRARHREWWFRPTALWAALLLAGAVFLGDARFFQYSLPMQMALVVPLATAAMSRRHPDGGVTWQT